MKFNKWLLAGMMAGALLAAGCTDDDDNKNAGNGDTPAVKQTVVDTPNWIGVACQCEGVEGECDLMGVPVPNPRDNGKIVGCDNVDPSVVEGGEKVCIRTISGEAAKVAPETYFPQGYCTISAIGCEGGSICNLAAYGDAKKMTSCPPGSTLIESVFNYKIITSDVIITNKTCARSCNTDDDCNKAGEMTCMSKGGVKFCYHQKNFDGTTNDYTVTPF